MSSIQISRYILCFSWIYQGVAPKLIHVAPLEKILTSSFGFSDEISFFITKFAGIAEAIFGIVLFIFYKCKPIILLNIFALTGLLIFVIFLQPQLLIEAFNPVTTNIPMIGLSLILLNNIKKASV